MHLVDALARMQLTASGQPASSVPIVYQGKRMTLLKGPDALAARRAVASKLSVKFEKCERKTLLQLGFRPARTETFTHQPIRGQYSNHERPYRTHHLQQMRTGQWSRETVQRTCNIRAMAHAERCCGVWRWQRESGRVWQWQRA